MPKYIYALAFGGQTEIFMSKTVIEGRNTVLTTRRRIIAVLLAFAVFLSYLLFNLTRLQCGMYEYYKEKVYDQITTSAPLRAKRGNIYDSNMNLLATSETVWRIFVSSRDIKKAAERDGFDYASVISTGLSDILKLDKEEIYRKITKTNVLDITVKKSVQKTEYEAVLKFIQKNNLESLVFTEASSSRYYPEETLAAHVLGFTGSDNQGLYGLEYSYNDVLSGKDGYYLYAKDANGNALPSEYSSYSPAEDGNSIVTTIDSYVQEVLESQLEIARINHDVKNRVTGIVMDTETGAILAMATSSPFNPNSPYELDALSEAKLKSSGLSEGSAEYKKYKKELLEIMWSNKAVSETYEPGSTFKIITVSTALNLGVASLRDRFSCVGFYEVGGWRIKCHKITGHGHGFNLAYGLQMSCNPTMMQIAERIGPSSFYSYFQNFGYLEKTGIDLPSEARTIFHKPENIGSTELATASFGQRFKVTVISHLTAIAAVANGGNLVTPYLVEKIISSDGKIVSEHKSESKRRVISEDVARAVSAVLEEGVSGSGGAKNAYVPGYKVAAKTGTSQKFDVLDANGNSYLRIGSTVAYSPSDESGVAVIIVVDEPMSAVKYGSFVAAPYISATLSSVLPYLGYKSNAESLDFSVESYVGLSKEDAEKLLKQEKINYEIVGSGATVIEQSPKAGDTITSELSKIILYTEKQAGEYVEVPDLVGLDALLANESAVNAGLNICITGNSVKNAVGSKVISQSLVPGSVVLRGSVITLNVLLIDCEE